MKAPACKAIQPANAQVRFQLNRWLPFLSVLEAISYTYQSNTRFGTRLPVQLRLLGKRGNEAERRTGSDSHYTSARRLY